MKWVLLGHVLGASVWVGGQIYIEGLMATAKRSGSVETMMTVGLTVAQTSRRVLIASAFATLVFGIWFVAANDSYTFEMGFVSIGMVATIIGLGIGLLVIKPKGLKAESIVAERGLTDPEAIATLKSVGPYAHAMTLTVVVALVVMVLKVGT